MEVLRAEEWKTRKVAYSTKILPWVEAFRKRRERRISHPVHDFLFEYYQCKRNLVAEWHPPIDVILEGQDAKEFLPNTNYSQNENGVFLNTELIAESVLNRIEWIRRLIESAQNRPIQTNCFGLHEWAMVYKTDTIRHQTTPLRLDRKAIEKVIESSTIRCSHFDAFRFFSEQAMPLNSIQLHHEDRRQNEHFGCVHFNMDLFKWCYKLHPWVSSELMLDCFFLAVEARELDMRASPYDLSDLGFESILIETSEGRNTYQKLQTQVGKKGRVLASRLLKECCNIQRAHSIQ
jgi:hypothetical protein